MVKDKLFTTQSRLLATLKEKALENTAGKGENAGNQHFSPFPAVISSVLKREMVLSATIDKINLSSANAIDLVMSKILSFGKGLTFSQTSPSFHLSVV